MGLIQSELNRYWQFFYGGKYHRNLIYAFLFVNAILYPKHKNNIGANSILAMLSGMALFLLLFVPNKLGYISYIFPFLIILSAHYLMGIGRAKWWILAPLIALMIAENGYKIVRFRNADFDGYLHRFVQYSWLAPAYGPSIGMYENMFGWYYPDHNHMWDQVIWKDDKSERLIDDLSQRKPEYLILDDGVYPFQCQPGTERAERFQVWVSQTYRVINSFEDEYYGHDWYNFHPGGKFKTTIWKRK